MVLTEKWRAITDLTNLNVSVGVVTQTHRWSLKAYKAVPGE